MHPLLTQMTASLDTKPTIPSPDSAVEAVQDDISFATVFQDLTQEKVAQAAEVDATPVLAEPETDVQEAAKNTEDQEIRPATDDAEQIELPRKPVTPGQTAAPTLPTIGDVSRDQPQDADPLIKTINAGASPVASAEIKAAPAPAKATSIPTVLPDQDRQLAPQHTTQPPSPGPSLNAVPDQPRLILPASHSAAASQGQVQQIQPDTQVKAAQTFPNAQEPPAAEIRKQSAPQSRDLHTPAFGPAMPAQNKRTQVAVAPAEQGSLIQNRTPQPTNTQQWAVFTRPLPLTPSENQKTNIAAEGEVLFTPRGDAPGQTQQHTQTLPIRHDLPQHIARQIAEAVQQLPNRPVEIMLNPEELGRVRLGVSTSEGGIMVTVLAERPETSDLMRRHIASLESAFQQLGYSDISFAFSGGTTAKAGADTDQADTPDENPDVANSDLPMAAQLRLSTAPLNGIDIRL